MTAGPFFSIAQHRGCSTAYGFFSTEYAFIELQTLIKTEEWPIKRNYGWDYRYFTCKEIEVFKIKWRAE